ncbi:hypothetical protein CH289_05595 [Rhodococcus sp. RS1C4]|nr:glycosyltransferase [Rhodococcus sp. RS1C4]OZC56196.1 hypothetical protein CH289_05595 [Rhodococcus sp. RS1C4]
MTTWAVGLVDYNSSDSTNRCIETVLKSKHSGDFLHILVVDNSQTYISSNKMVKIVHPGSNLGYAGAVNLLMHAARVLDVDYLWILNNDCEVSGDAIEQYEKADKRENYDLYTSFSTFGDHRTIWYGGGWVDRRSGRTSHLLYGQDIESHRAGTVEETSWASGANIVVPKRTLVRAVDWRNDFFLYLEELQWQMESGYTVGLISDNLVVHHAGSSTNAVSSDLEFFFSARNRIKLYPTLRSPSILVFGLHWVIDFLVRPLKRFKFRRLLLAALSPLAVVLPGDRVIEVCRAVGSR